MSRERLDGKGRGANTQDFDEKTAAPVPSDGVAKCKLHHLKSRWGVVAEDWRKTELVMVNCMGWVEIWRRTGLGDDAWFELSERRKA